MNKELVVGDYLFNTIEEANLAKAEKEKVDTLNTKLAKADIALLYKVYNKSIENKTFKTPIGLDYMKKLNHILTESSETPGEVLPVPVNNSSSVKEDLSSVNELKSLNSKLNQKSSMFKWSLIFNFVFIIVIILMFYITSTSNNPNILNYEHELINKYSSWEEELNERENAVRIKESELNIY